MRAALGAAVEGLRPATRGIAWVAIENLHLTLKFLGGVEAARLGDVLAALRQAAAGAVPFELAIRGLGAFPSVTRPRVIWAGVVEGAAAVAELAARVDVALAGLGFPRETRPFAGHVTLGRVRAPRRDTGLAEALGPAATRDFGRVRVARLSLMRSDLAPRGARYTELGGAPLGAASDSPDIDGTPSPS